MSNHGETAPPDKAAVHYQVQLQQLKDSLEGFVGGVQAIVDYVESIEKRLRVVEQLSAQDELRSNLRELKASLESINDEGVRSEALDTFEKLCDLLGVVDLETC